MLRGYIRYTSLRLPRGIKPVAVTSPSLLDPSPGPKPAGLAEREALCASIAIFESCSSSRLNRDGRSVVLSAVFGPNLSCSSANLHSIIRRLELTIVKSQHSVTVSTVDHWTKPAPKGYNAGAYCHSMLRGYIRYTSLRLPRRTKPVAVTICLESACSFCIIICDLCISFSKFDVNRWKLLWIDTTSIRTKFLQEIVAIKQDL
jgi:hypothetical protein